MTKRTKTCLNYQQYLQSKSEKQNNSTYNSTVGNKEDRVSNKNKTKTDDGISDAVLLCDLGMALIGIEAASLADVSVIAVQSNRKIVNDFDTNIVIK